ncbi:MAG: phosphate ABC transporter substrate-binding/OmpA family protein [Paracoccaceae bacterium]
MTPLKSKMTKLIGASIFALCAGWVQADTITLHAKTGSTSIEGKILDFDGYVYTVRTALGDLVLAANAVTCEGAACPAVEPELIEFKVAGSRSVTTQLLPKLFKAYAADLGATLETTAEDSEYNMYLMNVQDGTDLSVEFVHSNSAMGINKLNENAVQAALTTRTANELEQATAESAGLGRLRSEQQENVIAYDGLLVVTHPENPVRAMSENNVAQIFSGKLNDWSQLGRDSGPITVYLREAESSSRELLQEVLMKPNRQQIKTRVKILESDAEIAEAVRNDPNGIGLTSFAHRAGVTTLEIEGVCGIRVPATHFTIKTGEYPLSRPVYLYKTGAETPTAIQNFQDYMASDDAQSIIRQAGFVDRAITSEALNTQGLRVTHAVMREEDGVSMDGTKKMLKLMSNAKRLSTTIRFDNGSTELDATDYSELEALAKMAMSPEYKNTQVYFMGFSDSVGRADLNQFLALQRAEIVRQALVSRYPELSDRIKARSVGYGELSPLACNETRPGRKVNRRVEVWVHNPAAIAVN